jgi:predicted nucleic acid-binding protein
MVVQTVFLDTGVILDYLENRNQEVRDIIAQLLLLHKKARIVIATSVFNVAEMIDKGFEIHFIGWCLNERMSYDEIINKLRKDEKLFMEISKENQKVVEKRIKDFMFKNQIAVLPFSGDTEEYEELYNLIYRRQLRSQDALIIATALANKVTYFLSNDSDLIGKIGDMLDAYNLRDESLRKAFRNDVLEAV